MLEQVKTKGPFLEGPEMFLHLESPSKISELFYLHILLHTRSSRTVHLSVYEKFTGLSRNETQPLKYGTKFQVYCFVKVTSHGVFPTPFRIRNEAATISANSMPTGLLVSPPKPISFNLFLSSTENATEERGRANGFSDWSYGSRDFVRAIDSVAILLLFLVLLDVFRGLLHLDGI